MPDVPPTVSYRTPSGSVDPVYFERLFDTEPDPWGFETSAYEATKYQATLDALPRSRYASGLEVGCANGVLSEHLAARCACLLAVDVSEAALAVARERCGGVETVRFERRVLPRDMPSIPLDLVVLSEVGYYWSRSDLARAIDGFHRALAPCGHLALVHWTGETDYPLTGDAVHAVVLGDARWTSRVSERFDRFRIDVVERA